MLWPEWQAATREWPREYVVWNLVWSCGVAIAPRLPCLQYLRVWHSPTRTRSDLALFFVKCFDSTRLQSGRHIFIWFFCIIISSYFWVRSSKATRVNGNSSVEYMYIYYFYCPWCGLQLCDCWRMLCVEVGILTLLDYRSVNIGRYSGRSFSSSMYARSELLRKHNSLECSDPWSNSKGLEYYWKSKTSIALHNGYNCAKG